MYRKTSLCGCGGIGRHTIGNFLVTKTWCCSGIKSNLPESRITIGAHEASVLKVRILPSAPSLWVEACSHAEIISGHGFNRKCSIYNKD